MTGSEISTERPTAREIFDSIAMHGRPPVTKVELPAHSHQGVDGDLIAMREHGWKIAEIAEQANLSERTVQAIMREHGLCRDQRLEREYVVTVAVPEIVRVKAVSEHQARERTRAAYNAAVRVVACEEVEDD